MKLFSFSIFWRNDCAVGRIERWGLRGSRLCTTLVSWGSNGGPFHFRGIVGYFSWPEDLIEKEKGRKNGGPSGLGK